MCRRDSGSARVCSKAKRSEQTQSQPNKFYFDPRSSSHILCSLGLSAGCCRDSVKFIDRHRFLSSHFEILFILFFWGVKVLGFIIFPKLSLLLLLHTIELGDLLQGGGARRRRRRRRSKTRGRRGGGGGGGGEEFLWQALGV